MLTTIPFMGFYESIWTSELDRAEESRAEYLTGDPDADAGEGVDGYRGRSVSDVCEALYWVTSYNVAHAAIAKDYAEGFADQVDRECGWPVRLRYDVMDSPREYNFTTDRIFMHVPRASVRRMRKECNDAILQRIARERFTSCSGFISSYANDTRQWGPLDKWDHNQVATLLVAWMETSEIDDPEGDIFESMMGNGSFDDALANAYVESELLARLQGPNMAACLAPAPETTP